MDPNACLAELIEAIVDKDRETVAERCDNLREWVGRGGFLPTVPVGLAAEMVSLLLDELS